MPLLTGLDGGGEGLRVAALKRRGDRFELRRLAAVDLRDVPGAGRGLPPEEVAAVLRQGLKEARLPMRRIVASIPGTQVVIRSVTVPPVPKWKLDLIMKYELEGMRPPDAPEILGDYQPIGTFGEEGEWRVLAAMARPEAAAERLELARSLGARLVDLEPPAVALFEFLAGDPEFEAAGLALGIHVGDEAVDVCLAAAGRLLFARSLMPGGARIVEAAARAAGGDEGGSGRRLRAEIEIPAGEEVPAEELRVFQTAEAPAAGGEGETAPAEPLDPAERARRIRIASLGAAREIAQGVQAALRFAQTQFREGEPQAAWLAGPFAAIPGLAAFLASRLGIPVRVASLPPDIDDRRLPADEARALRANPSAFAVPIGLARLRLRPAAVRLSLLPSASKERQRFFQRAVFERAAAVLFAAGVAVSLGGAFASSRSAGSYVDEAAVRVREAKTKEGALAPKEAERAGERAEAKALVEEIAIPRRVLALLAVLKERDRTPTAITLTGIPQDTKLAAFQFGEKEGVRGKPAGVDRNRIWIRGIVDVPGRRKEKDVARLKQATDIVTKFALGLRDRGAIFDPEADLLTDFVENPVSPGSKSTEWVIVFALRLTLKGGAARENLERVR